MLATLRLSLLLLFVLAAAVCQAQDTAPSNAEPMQELSWVVGDWSAAIPAKKGIPGLVEQGDQLLLEMSCEWGLDHKVIAVTWDVKAGSTVLVTHKGMIGWDAGKEQIVSVGFDSAGEYATSTWSNANGKWMVSAYVSKPSEGSASKTHEISDIQSDQFTFQTIKSERAGNPEPPGAKVIFTRVK